MSYKNSNRTLALVFILVFSWNSAVFAMPHEYLGVWEGNISQGQHSFSAKITLYNDYYRIDHPSLGCGGKMDIISAKGNKVEFKSILTYGQAKCISGGQVTLVFGSNDKAKYQWNFPNGKFGSTGTLSHSIKPTIKKNSNDSIFGNTGIAHYEVDGIALGDPMESVLRQLEIKASDLKEEFYSNGASFDENLIAKDKAKVAQAEWREFAPRKYTASITKENATYYLTFNHQKVLVGFSVKKYYNKLLRMEDIKKKLISKYGKPIEERTNSSEYKKFRFNHGLDLYKISSDYMMVYVNKKARDQWELQFNLEMSALANQNNTKSFQQEQKKLAESIKAKYPIIYDSAKNLDF